MRRRNTEGLKRPKRIDQVVENEGNSQSDGEVEESRSSGSSAGVCGRCWRVGKYVLLALIIPPILNYASLTREAKELKPPGVIYDIGLGQKMYLHCTGHGTPTVILDAPTGMSSDVWTLVQPQLAKITRVCVYDRAGLGFSERPSVNYTQKQPAENEGENEGEEEEKVVGRKRWKEFTIERMVDDLYRLVTYSSEQHKPFILVGSEMGSLVARFYATLFESEVSHLVLIDPLVENIFSQDHSVWAQFWFDHLLPSFQSLQLSAAVGATRLAILVGLMDQPITGEDVPLEVIRRQKHLMCHPRHLSSVVDEHHFINDTFSQIDLINRIKSFPSNISVTVITGNYYDEQLPSSLNKAWAKSQQHLISRLHPGSNHIVVNGADHHMLYRQPSAIVEPLKRIIRKVQLKSKPARTAKL